MERLVEGESVIFETYKNRRKILVKEPDERVGLGRGDNLVREDLSRQERSTFSSFKRDCIFGLRE